MEVDLVTLMAVCEYAPMVKLLLPDYSELDETRGGIAESPLSHSLGRLEEIFIALQPEGLSADERWPWQKTPLIDHEARDACADVWSVVDKTQTSATKTLVRGKEVTPFRVTEIDDALLAKFSEGVAELNRLFEAREDDVLEVLAAYANTDGEMRSREKSTQGLATGLATQTMNELRAAANLVIKSSLDHSSVVSSPMERLELTRAVERSEDRDLWLSEAEARAYGTVLTESLSLYSPYGFGYDFVAVGEASVGRDAPSLVEPPTFTVVSVLSEGQVPGPDTEAFREVFVRTPSYLPHTDGETPRRGEDFWRSVSTGDGFRWDQVVNSAVDVRVENGPPLERRRGLTAEDGLGKTEVSVADIERVVDDEQRNPGLNDRSLGSPDLPELDQDFGIER